MSWAVRLVIRAIGIGILLASIFLIPNIGFQVVFGLLAILLIMVS